MPRAPNPSRSSRSGAKTRLELADRLRARRPEIEVAFLTRAYAIGAPGEIEDAEYQEGFRRAVFAAFDFTVSVVGREGETPPIPVALLNQARLAARHSVGLDTLLRRYSAGFALLDGFVVREIDQQTWLGVVWQRFVHDRAAAFDVLLSGVTAEHQREVRASRQASGTDRGYVGRLLQGEQPTGELLSYDFEGTHVGLVARGVKVKAAVVAIARALDCRHLIVPDDDHTTWAWLGWSVDVDRNRVDDALRELWPQAIVLALGEPASGISGWRLSHHQARATLPVALLDESRIAWYADVCLVSAAMQSHVLVRSLQSIFLQPLNREKDGGRTLRKTLATYFSLDRNGVSTAASLGVSRQTIANRLGVVEALLGRPLTTCSAELELALRLHTAGLVPTCGSSSTAE